MLVSIDIETGEYTPKTGFTPILDTNKYIIGDLYDGKKHYTTTNKKELWNHIQELAKKEQKNGHTLTIAGHNIQYDFYGIADYNTPGLKILNEHPFLATLKINNKNAATFIDTMNHYKMSLKRAAQLIGTQKLEMPEQLPLTEVTKYLHRDTEITYNLITTLKKWTQKHGAKIKRTLTINQIAINFMLNKLRTYNNTENIFQDKNKTTLRKPSKFYNPDGTIQEDRADLIHQAYRTGRNECFQTGTFTNIYALDKKSMYPWATTQIRMPDLKTEKKIRTPLKYMTPQELTQRIGITHCMITNNTDTLGTIPVRTTIKTTNGEIREQNHYIRPGQTAIGAWTNQELQHALKNGHIITESEWSLTYQDTQNNPISQYMKEMYKIRTETNHELDKYLAKQMMNCALGKMAQRKEYQTIEIDSVETAPKRTQQGYTIIKGLDNQYVYKKTTNKPTNDKKYYCPIIPTLVNAHARTAMNNEYRKIPPKDLIYTDNDSIFTKGDYSHKYKIGTEMGDMEQKYTAQEMVIWGNKTYMIGDTIKIGGINSRQINTQDFKYGVAKGNKMTTIKTQSQDQKAGTFKTETRNLKAQLAEHEHTKKQLEQRKVYIDTQSKDITHYIQALNNLIKEGEKK